jgi:hypothetical protein
MAEIIAFNKYKKKSYLNKAHYSSTTCRILCSLIIQQTGANADKRGLKKSEWPLTKFSYKEIIDRDRANLDIFWLKDEI